jgi:hypothetical protein
MGWVLVHYPTTRRVLVDDDDLGETNTLLYVGVDGTHTFSLDPPPDFEPDSVTRRVINTTRDLPLELTFKPKAG